MKLFFYLRKELIFKIITTSVQAQIKIRYSTGFIRQTCKKPPAEYEITSRNMVISLNVLY